MKLNDDDPAGLAARIADHCATTIVTELLLLGDGEFRETIHERLHGTIHFAVLTYANLARPHCRGCGEMVPSETQN